MQNFFHMKVVLYNGIVQPNKLVLVLITKMQRSATKKISIQFFKQDTRWQHFYIHVHNGGGARRDMFGMPLCLNAPVAMHVLPSRNAPFAKSQCSNREVAIHPHFGTLCSQCTTFGQNAPLS